MAEKITKVPLEERTGYDPHGLYKYLLQLNERNGRETFEPSLLQYLAHAFKENPSVMGTFIRFLVEEPGNFVSMLRNPNPNTWDFAQVVFGFDYPEEEVIDRMAINKILTQLLIHYPVLLFTNSRETLQKAYTEWTEQHVEETLQFYQTTPRGMLIRAGRIFNRTGRYPLSEKFRESLLAMMKLESNS